MSVRWRPVVRDSLVESVDGVLGRALIS